MGINYQELSFIMKIASKEAKIIFQDVSGMATVKTSDNIDINSFINKVGVVRSVDQRLDGKCKFIFMLDQCKKSYRNYLNEKSFIKRMKFTGGAAVFYKILNKEEIEFIEKNLKYKNTQIYNFK